MRYRLNSAASPTWKNCEFSSTRLSGSIEPPELGSLSNLTYLNLQDNRLSGKIPSELGNLSNLEWLILNLNWLTGPIPPELGNLSNLEELTLSYNLLSGEIPPELGRLSNLTDLGLSGNQLTGPIQSWLGSLSNLEKLWLAGNQWTGCIPAGLRDMPMYRNDFRILGLPFCVADRAALVALYNATDGPNWTNNANWLTDKPLGQWHGVTTDDNGRVTHLVLDDNRLAGEMPTALENLAILQELSFSSNKLAGEIPSELGKTVQLGTVGLIE